MNGASAIRTLVLAALTGAAGCAPNDAPPQPTNAPPPDPRRDVEVLAPRWPGVERLDHATLDALPETTRTRLADVGLPVLLPRDARLSVGTFVGKSMFYSQSTRVEGGELAGTHVVVSATRVAHRYASVAPVTLTDRVRGVPALVTRNEGIPRVSFDENGVSYTVEIVCDAPTDARCTSDAAVRALAEDLVFVGGDAVSGRAVEGGAR